MALPTVVPITLGQVRDEAELVGASEFRLTHPRAREIAAKPTGTIKLTDCLGKSYADFTPSPFPVYNPQIEQSFNPHEDWRAPGHVMTGFNRPLTAEFAVADVSAGYYDGGATNYIVVQFMCWATKPDGTDRAESGGYINWERYYANYITNLSGSFTITLYPGDTFYWHVALNSGQGMVFGNPSDAWGVDAQVGSMTLTNKSIGNNTGDLFNVAGVHYFYANNSGLIGPV